MPPTRSCPLVHQVPDEVHADAARRLCSVCTASWRGIASGLNGGRHPRYRFENIIGPEADNIVPASSVRAPGNIRQISSTRRTHRRHLRQRCSAPLIDNARNRANSRAVDDGDWCSPAAPDRHTAMSSACGGRGEFPNSCDDLV
jgi:hypothetical protein